MNFKVGDRIIDKTDVKLGTGEVFGISDSVLHIRFDNYTYTRSYERNGYHIRAFLDAELDEVASAKALLESKGFEIKTPSFHPLCVANVLLDPTLRPLDAWITSTNESVTFGNGRSMPFEKVKELHAAVLKREEHVKLYGGG